MLYLRECIRSGHNGASHLLCVCVCRHSHDHMPTPVLHKKKATTVSSIC